MKSKLLKIGSILFGTIFFLAIFGLSPIIVKANEELYFDCDGNLYYVTREKKATSSVKYYTIGWTIKRYDMPIDVPGQQYVIVTKSNYKPDEVDPNNDKYVYCYYRSDKEEILQAVKSVSTEWYNTLVRYGDTVYIDSVMTVKVDGEQKGYLYQGGQYTGEVYFDYEGIAGARDWASPESLRVNFGMSVEFPMLYRSQTTSIVVLSQDTINVSSSMFSSASNGAIDYDIASGIPSGEKMYFQSSVSKGIYTASLNKISGEMKIDVEVPVTYILRWTDYYGVKREEKKVVKRYYTVNRKFSYYTYKGFEEKKLEGVELSSSLFNGVQKINNTNTSSGNVDKGSVRYDGINGHMLGYDIYSSVDPASVVLTSNTYLKPSIPEADYSEYAEKKISQLKVRNDKVVINNQLVLSDEIVRSQTNIANRSIPVENVVLESENIVIDEGVYNGAGYTISGKYIYKDAAGNRVTYNVSGLKPVVVHTPVICNESVVGQKELNQAVEPKSRDVVLGSKMIITFNDFGMHKNIKGYGIRSYTSYIKKRQIRCGFAVVYKGVRYEPGTWIETDDYHMTLDICEDNNEGTYLVETRVIANNGPDICEENIFEENANLTISKYGALSSEEVRLIGRIEGFNVELNDEKKYPENMPLTLKLEEENEMGGKSYTLAIETVGDIGEEDYLEVHYNYYVVDETGEYIPVWVYEVKNRDIILGESLSLLSNVDIWSRECAYIEGNKGIWKKVNTLPEEFVVVREGITGDDIKQAVISGKIGDIIIKDQSLYIAAEFVRVKDGKAYISYINESNAKKGYCNMWLREGGRDETPYGIFMEIGLAETVFYDYEVSGTH